MSNNENTNDNSNNSNSKKINFRNDYTKVYSDEYGNMNNKNSIDY